MTRINTNVSSLTAQKSLARSNVSLQQALTRLSTGLRINTGKDDPAGLIASEELRSDIVSVKAAISNSQRANQVIAVADSALNEVSSLLNDIRALVTEAANEGAMSPDQIAANQLQIDSSLEALNRIAQTTSFQGRRLLDGSLDFVTTAGEVPTIEDIQIDQANLGATGQINVDVDIAAGATQAAITNSIGTATNATATLNFAASVTTTAAASGAILDIVATSPGTAEDGVNIMLTTGNLGGVSGNETAVYDSGAATLTITIDGIAGSTAALVADAINAQVGEFSATVNAPGVIDAGDIGSLGVTGIDNVVVDALTPGADFNGLEISMRTQSGLGVGNEFATYNAVDNEIIVTIDDAAVTTVGDVANAIAALADFNATGNVVSDGNVDPTGADANATANTGVTGGNLLDAALVVEISGTDGADVFYFEAGAAVNQIVAAVNLVSDATGVAASQSAGTLTLNSTGYGSKALVNVDVISEGAGGTFENGLSAARALGTDIDAMVNGITANGDGNTLSINTSMLDLTITVTAGSSTDFEFDITGGGALFQLGPDVVSNQQARLGIMSVSAATLRGVTGRLYELGTGQSAALDTDTTRAYRIVDQVITKVTALRGRLGAFQKTTLETNINSLTDTVENLTAAESEIRDADFAAETSALTRSQILVQSGVSVLAIANTTPQNVLALLR